LASVRQPCAPAASTIGSTAGLAARCGDSGTCAVQVSPCQAWDHWPAVSITSPVSGKNSSFLPRTDAGSPSTFTLIAWPVTSTWLAPASGLGRASKLAWNAAPLPAVVLRTGTLKANSPSSGMHSWRQTSQLTLSLTGRSSEIEGLKSGAMVKGTGSSTVPS